MNKHEFHWKQYGVLWLTSLIAIALFIYPLVLNLVSGINSANNTVKECDKQQTTSFCEIVGRTARHSTAKDVVVPAQPVISSTGTSSNGNTSVSTPTASSYIAWKLVWADEFQGTTLNTTRWTALSGGNFYTPHTSENYAPDDTYIQPGQGLILKSEKRSYRGFNYTSGGVSTREKFSLLYGKIECREQLPQGKGIWPAIWLMPENGSDSNELDLLELVGDAPHDIQMNYHWFDANGDRQQNISHFTGPDFSAAYHTYDLEWLPNALIWSIDGVIVKTITTDIVSVPMFMYINTAIGANNTWPGPPDDTTVFPQYTKVSYVRVYKAA